VTATLSVTMTLTLTVTLTVPLTVTLTVTLTATMTLTLTVTLTVPLTVTLTHIFLHFGFNEPSLAQAWTDAKSIMKSEALAADAIIHRSDYVAAQELTRKWYFAENLMNPLGNLKIQVDCFDRRLYDRKCFVLITSQTATLIENKYRDLEARQSSAHRALNTFLGFCSATQISELPVGCHAGPNKGALFFLHIRQPSCALASSRCVFHDRFLLDESIATPTPLPSIWLPGVWPTTSAWTRPFFT